jgi:CheY-like chemotaxis protein
LRDPDTPLDLRKVAERAGKSRTAPYLEFGKESEGGGLGALKMAVAAAGFAELTERLQAVGLRSREAGAAIRDMARAYLSFARREPRLYRLMFGEDIGGLLTGRREGSPEGHVPHKESERLFRARLRLQQYVEQVVARGLREQAVRVRPGIDLQRHVMVFWAMLHGTALLMLDGQLDIALGHVTHEEAARLATEHLLVGLDQSILRSARALAEAKRMKRQVEEQPVAREAAARGKMRFMKWRIARPEELEGEERVEEPVRDERLAGLEPDELAAEAEAAELLEDTEPLDLLAEPDAEGQRVYRLEASSPDRERLSLWQSGVVTGLPAAPAESRRPLIPGALRRARNVRDALVGARILWVDDHPEWQRAEREMLEALGVEVHMVPNSGSALTALRREPFHLVISDIARGGSAAEGLRALPAIREVSGGVPVIFYVGDLDEGRGVPPGAFGITNQVEELLHLVLDVVERGRVG